MPGSQITLVCAMWATIKTDAHITHKNKWGYFWGHNLKRKLTNCYQSII
jgi:hypothetical protein